MKISVINISRNGERSAPMQMELEHYLKAKKVQPDRFDTADEAAAKIVSKIPMEAVPIGTTMDDVSAFEANRGKHTVKGQSRFEMLLKAAESGTDITDVDDTLLDKSADLTLVSEQAPAGFKSEMVDTKPGEILDPNKIDPNKVVADMQKTDPPEKVSKYNKDDLLKMPLDKLQAIVEVEVKDAKMKAQLLKTKKKEVLVDSLIQLTKK